MIFGGIPYYLNMLRRGRSLAQSVDALCFSENAPLSTEFTQLCETLFTDPTKPDLSYRHHRLCSCKISIVMSYPQPRVSTSLRGQFLFDCAAQPPGHAHLFQSGGLDNLLLRILRHDKAQDRGMSTVFR